MQASLSRMKGTTETYGAEVTVVVVRQGRKEQETGEEVAQERNEEFEVGE